MYIYVPPYISSIGKLQGYPQCAVLTANPAPLFMSYCKGAPSHPTWKPVAVHTFFISFLPLALTLPSPGSCLTWEIT